MNHIPIESGNRNGNSRNSQALQPQPVTSSERMGHPLEDAASVGTGRAQPARPLAPVTSANPSNRYGGQYHIGLFGLKTDRKPTPQAVKADDQPRRVNGQTFGQRRARLDALILPPIGYKLPDLERQDRLEREAEEAAARAATTLAMRRAALDSEAREEREWYRAAHDEQEDSYSRFLAQWFPHAQDMMEGGVA